MWEKIKAKILDNSHDELLHTIQTSAIVVMMFCTLTFFMVRQFLHSLLWLHITIFIIALLIAVFIGTVWFLKEFIPYRELALKQFYEENPELAPKDKSKKEKK